MSLGLHLSQGLYLFKSLEYFFSYIFVQFCRYLFSIYVSDAFYWLNNFLNIVYIDYFFQTLSENISYIDMFYRFYSLNESVIQVWNKKKSESSIWLDFVPLCIRSTEAKGGIFRVSDNISVFCTVSSTNYFCIQTTCLVYKTQ